MVVEVVGWFVSPIISKLIDTAREYAGEKSRLQTDLKVNMGKLAEDLKYISQTVEKVRTRRINSQSNKDGDDPLWWLRDALDEAEDVLDLFEYEILKVHLKKKRRSSGPTEAMDSSAEDARVRPIAINEPLKSQLQKVSGNLGNVRERVLQDLQLHASSSTVPPPIASRKEAGLYPVMDKEHFFGYDKEYARLISMLKNGKDKLVIAILGHGLMGKTELARQAFHDVTRGYFDLPIWVPACNKFTEIDLLKEIWKSVADNIHACNKFTGTDLLKEIWKSVAGRPGNIPVDEMNVPILQQKLGKLLKEKRYLLVLDDIWHDESATSDTQRKEAWKTALAPFERFGKEGSRILMTTRAKICSTTLNADETIVLNRISTDIEKTYLFSENAFTYKHLPPHLQRCFAFCSIFPTNWRFEPEKLTKMWIAHGFVEDTDGKSMEDVARGYFDDLVDRSLFEEKRDKETEYYYVIHEHIHSMIRQVSANCCMSIAGAQSRSIPRTVRHLSVTHGCLGQLPEFGELNKLRTLLVLKDDDPSSMPSPLSAIDNVVLKKFKGVRVLDVTETGVTQLPESIGDLKHLRYLGLPYTMRNLPDQVTRLLFLQTFCVSKRCQQDRKCLPQIRFPDDMNTLINMRHLDIDIECIANISGIGRLDKLQGSIEFQANKETEGHKMSELAGMNSLKGTLSIKGLETVKSKEEAKEAQFKAKKLVKALKLEWGPPDPLQVGPNAGSSAATAIPILEEGLQPHPNLQELSIKRYGGTKSPTWLADRSALAKLMRLYLWNCRELQDLPATGELPCLELLDIKELPSVQRIHRNFCGNGGTFPKLKKIVLNDMVKLISWDDMPEQAFPQLREVSIIDCPSLSSLSGLGCCSGPLNLCVMRCPTITQETLPANFTSGDCKCIFQ